ncbi:unnamed protein product [Pleuronectes platessa]|uniref:Uncharacterized protein n=1 Tax=Pleuronectes platessa TaxID=8262 RepID=A0A9N7U1N3_PLEPL|nr:unnamed protein product [Pleuronectes platessa]
MFGVKGRESESGGQRGSWAAAGRVDDDDDEDQASPLLRLTTCSAERNRLIDTLNVKSLRFCDLKKSLKYDTVEERLVTLVFLFCDRWKNGLRGGAEQTGANPAFHPMWAVMCSGTFQPGTGESLSPGSGPRGLYTDCASPTSERGGACGERPCTWTPTVLLSSARRLQLHRDTFLLSIDESDLELRWKQDVRSDRSSLRTDAAAD